MYNKNFFSSNKLIEISKRVALPEKDEELFTNDWRDNKTPRSLQNSKSYLRLAISYARKYSSYGLPIDDLIHEGVLGIGARRKNLIPQRILDFNLCFLVIRASIQDYILKNYQW